MALIVAAATSVWAASPFQVSLRARTVAREGLDLAVTVTVPAGHLVYADSFKIISDPAALPVTTAPTVESQDPFDSDKRVKAFPRSFETVWRIPSIRNGSVVTVELQGCDDKVCFLPETRQFSFRQAINQFVEAREEATADASGINWKQGRAVTMIGGYLSASELLVFLDRVEGKPVSEPSALAAFLENPITFFKRYGVWLTVLLVLMAECS
jgi:hypothetical protein